METRQEPNPKKIWVVIIGGTGEKTILKNKVDKNKIDINLHDELNNVNSLLAEIAEKEKLISALENTSHGLANTKENNEKIVEIETRRGTEILNLGGEIDQLTKKCDEIIKTKFYGSYEYFLPPVDCISRCHVDLVKGAPEKSLTGNEEFTYIEKFMEQLKEANPKPELLVFSGHSRGASTCIEIARRVYIEYGNSIKMDMNLSDPVPGPGKHTESKKMIPSNVESLTLAYAGKETNYLLFVPQNINKLVYDKDHTHFTAIVLPSVHRAPSPELKKINQAYWSIVHKGETVEKIEVASTEPYKIEKHRRKRIGSMTSIPDKKDLKNTKRKEFHQILQTTFQTDNLMKAKSAATQIEEKVEFDTPEKREEQLKQNYKLKLNKSQGLAKAQDSKESSSSDDSLHKSKKPGKK